MDQRRGLKFLPTAFTGQFRKGQFPKFFRDERQLLVPSREVTLFFLRQDLSDVRNRREAPQDPRLPASFRS